MDRAPLEQQGQPQPIFPNEMLHERKHKTTSSGCPLCTHSYFLGYLQNLELAAPAADVVGTRALKVFFKNLHRCKAGIHFSLVANI